MKKTLAVRLEERFGKQTVDLSGPTPAIAPVDEDALSGFLRYASEEKIGVMAVGGGTVPETVCLGDAVRLSLAGFHAVQEVSAGDSVVVAQAGAVVDDAVAAAGKGRLLLPLDPSSGARSTVGGAYMTGAVGPYAAGYGPFRDAVLGVRCMTAKGETVVFGGRTMKNVTGYEVTRFLSGTMGLFAVAVELILRAVPLPERRTVIVGRFPAGSAPFAAARDVERAGTAVKSSELVAEDGLGGVIVVGIAVEGMDGAVGRAVKTVREVFGRAGAESVVENTPEEFTRFRRAAAAKIVGASLSTVTAPPSATPALLGAFRAIRPGSPVIAHPLLGRIHLRADNSDTARAVEERTLAAGGKRLFSRAQAARLGIAGMFAPEELALARSLKRELDPAGILNPHLRLG